MDTLFLSILNMSLTGAFVIAAICLARQLLKKAPKIISYALWAVVGFRLVFPFTIESMFSLIPFNPSPIPPDIAMQTVPRIDSGIPLVNNAVSNVLPAAVPYYSANPLQIWVSIGAWAWFFGLAILMIYGLVSFFLLKRKMQKSMWVEANIYEADNIKSPFVLGIFSPKIYLPVGLSKHERGYILLHEQTHIRRHDHIVKFVAYFILCLHWFNPLAWLAFWLMGADMEMSCDERVVKELGDDISEDYSMSLVRIATGKRIMVGSPLAFGEGGIKERVKRVLNFKKPTRVVIVTAAILAVILSLGFAVNRTSAISLADDERFTMEIIYVDNPASFMPDMKLIWDDAVYHVTNIPIYTLERGGLIGFANDNVSTWRIYELMGHGYDYLLAVESENVWRVMSIHPPEQPIMLFVLENATESQRLTRLLSVSLYADGTATLAIPLISSYMFWQPLFYTFSNGELLIHGEDGNLIARFEELDKSTIVFRETTVPLFADEGARYVIHSGNRTSGALSQEILNQIYLGMTNENVFTLFGEPDFHASGLVWYGYTNIGIFDPMGTTGLVERISLNNGISWSVRELISTAVKQHYAGHFYEPDGSFATEAHTILALDANPQRFSAYVVSLFMNYLPDGEDDVREISGGHSHIVLTFERNQYNQYDLVEFWEPEPGTNHMPSVRARFPEDTWSSIDTQRFINAHSAATREQAMIFFFGEQNIWVLIEDDGYGDDAMEFIYEDDYYRYYLSSVRSNRIMLTFENGQRISLNEALSQQKITVSDLMLNGLSDITPIAKFENHPPSTAMLDYATFLELLAVNGFEFESENYYVRNSATGENMFTSHKAVYIGDERIIVLNANAGQFGSNPVPMVQISWVPSYLWSTEDYTFTVVYSGDNERIIAFLSSIFSR